MARTNFGSLLILLVTSRRMFVLATLVTLLQQMSGTPYITGGHSAAGTDCSGLASLVSNVATDRPAFGDRFNTGNEESALLARGFKYGTAPGALVIGPVDPEAPEDAPPPPFLVSAVAPEPPPPPAPDAAPAEDVHNDMPAPPGAA